MFPEVSEKSIFRNSKKKNTSPSRPSSVEISRKLSPKCAYLPCLQRGNVFVVSVVFGQTNFPIFRLSKVFRFSFVYSPQILSISNVRFSRTCSFGPPL